MILGVEPLNRYETSLINTVEQGLELLELVGHDAVALCLDLFHMNIEERDLPAAIRRAGGRLCHLHVSGNDRGAPGGGHLPWSHIAAALQDISYDGSVVLESFAADVASISRAASVWRPPAPDADHLARAGIDFMRSVFSR